MGAVTRRAFLASGAAYLAAPGVGEAQQSGTVYRIGLLAGFSPTSPEASHIWAGFFQGLRELGYFEGQNIVIQGRFYGDSIDRLPGLAAELVRLPVDVIVATAPPAPEAAKRATSTIPIVMANHPDPVGSGLVTSLGRPGGNVTGLSLLAVQLRVKMLELLKEAVPRLRSVAVLANPTVPSHARDLKDLEAAARSLNVRLNAVAAQAPSEFSRALALAAKERADALIILSGSMFFAHRARLAEMAARSRLPSIYLLREYAVAGGLMTYGVDLRESFRRAAEYVDRILKGTHPGVLPVAQPTKFELVINLKTAKALGLTIPPSLLARADQVIE